MSNWWLGFFAGFIPAAAAATLGWLKWWHELSQKRREALAKTKAEAELAAIRSRSFDISPYLIISDQRFNGVQIAGKDPGTSIWLTAGHPNLICFMRDEVDRSLPAKGVVFVTLENEGGRALDVKLKLDGEECDLKEPENEEAQNVILLVYPYRPDIHGQIQTLEMDFLRKDGVRDLHRYEIKHGVRWLRRTSP